MIHRGLQHIALIVDGDQASPSALRGIRKKLKHIGTIQHKAISARFPDKWKEFNWDYLGQPRGSVDIDLSLHAIQLEDFDTFVIYTSDGDFISLVDALIGKGKSVILAHCTRYNRRYDTHLPDLEKIRI